MFNEADKEIFFQKVCQRIDSAVVTSYVNDPRLNVAYREVHTWSGGTHHAYAPQGVEGWPPGLFDYINVVAEARAREIAKSAAWAIIQAIYTN